MLLNIVNCRPTDFFYVEGVCVCVREREWEKVGQEIKLALNLGMSYKLLVHVCMLSRFSRA